MEYKIYKESSYAVFRDGRVLNTKTNLIKKTKVDNRGYESIDVYVDGRKVYTTVHLLVARCFIPNPLNKPQVNHINGIKTDNRVENLEWVTAKENVHHAIKNGLIGSKVGKKHLTKSERMEVLSLRHSGMSAEKIADKFNVCLSTVTAIKIDPNNEEYIANKRILETKNSLVNNKTREVFQYSLNGEFIKKWDSLNSASRELNIDNGSIGQACRGRRKTAGGFVWKLGELKLN